MGIVGRPADQSVLDLEGGHAAGVEPVDDARELGHDLRSDPVAGQQQQLECRHGDPIRCEFGRMRAQSTRRRQTR
jgi:hypothetical protein